ncbi:MAG: terminase TerL endonuclease subunit [Pseudomonadota bacterium]
MGLRGHGAASKPVADNRQGHLGLDLNDLDPLRSRLPWEEEGFSRLDRLIAFLEDLPITQGSLAGTHLRLRPWQREFLAAVYSEGPDGRRPVRTAVLSMARKNGKTQLVAGLALAHLLGPEAEGRGEVYAAANDKAQAGKTFLEMKAILEAHRELGARANIINFHKRIEVRHGAGRGSIFQALSADASTKQGLSPSFVVYDELGTAPKRDLYEALDTAMGARDDPLMCVISTQASSDTAALSTLVDYGLKVNAGEVDDPSFHLTLYAADLEDDPWCEATWRKANPALGDFRSIEDVRRQAAQAQRMPAAEQGFRNLILNQRVDAHVRFLSKREWDNCAGGIDFDRLRGRACWAGLDLSQSRDLTAFVMVFPDKDGGLDVYPRFFLPERGIDEKSDLDRVPYDVWARDGYLSLIPGATVDPSYVAEAIADACATYDVKSIAYDRWRIEDLRRELARMNVAPPLEPFGQGFRDMAPAIDKLERLVAEGSIRHAGNPILTFCAAN